MVAAQALGFLPAGVPKFLGNSPVLLFKIVHEGIGSYPSDPAPAAVLCVCDAEEH